ncbi:MAG: phosphomannomutase/phosphoglucomutase [Firmicutes bacterium]|nr:phosphomannomutase/phosphoglucomutase [Bacillota bacterium]
MEIHQEIFREYDIRGIVDQDLTPDIVRLLGQAYGTYIQEKGEHEVIVGRDNRLSSPAFREAMVDGLLSTGVDVIDIGLVPTPVFYYSRVHYGKDGGVMITASHNPPEYNGFKLAHGFGTLYGDEIQEIYRRMVAGSFHKGEGRLSTANPIPDYIAEITSKVKLGPKPLKVVADCGNGATSVCAISLLKGLGCEVIPLYAEPDGRFPNHHPDPVEPENLQDLIAEVKRSHADVGVAFDGDGDRLGAVDETGSILWGDEMMILFWREILPKYPDKPCIVEVKCSQALVEEIERLGGKTMFYKTGHSLIKAKMQEVGAVFTGEMSGHMFFADEYYGYDDAMYAAARLLRILSNEERSFSQIRQSIPHYFSTPETRVDCPDDVKFDVVARVQEHYRARYDVIDIDGARVLFPDGWGLVRASNTQPALVLRAESKTEEGLERIKRDLEETLRQMPQVGRIGW